MKITRHFVFRMAVTVVAVCFLMLCVPRSQGQETADILGTVTDATGSVVPGADVTLTNNGTYLTIEANQRGRKLRLYAAADWKL